MISGEFLLYETEDGKTRVECRFVEDTLWLTQALMAELFQKDVRTINETCTIFTRKANWSWEELSGNSG